MKLASPQPIDDLDAWLAHNWQWFDPLHAHRIEWPDRAFRPILRLVSVPGCGRAQVIATCVQRLALCDSRVLE